MRLHLPTLALVVLTIGCTTGTAPVLGVDGGADLCEGQTCSGHGSCAVVGGRTIACICDSGFTAQGTTCIAVTAGAECDGVDCGGNGSCIVARGTPDVPVCQCRAGFKQVGNTTCVALTNPCEGVTCGGNGTCAVRGTEPLCACNPGFSLMGTTMCAPTAGSPCEGVTCSGQGQCGVVGAAARCLCNPGFIANGTSCEPAAASPCNGVTCSGFGTCAVTTAGQARCLCDPGYAAVSTTSCVLAPGNPCTGVTCSSRGTCAVVSGSTPACICDAGYVPSGLACVIPGTVGGDLTLLAGALGGRGYLDGAAPNRLSYPKHLVADAAGHVYVAENNTIRKIAPNGSIATLAGVNDQAGYVDGTGAAARFKSPSQPVLDSAGNLYVFDSCSVRQITPAGVVSTFAGNEFGRCGFTPIDGIGTAAAFLERSAMTIDSASGTLWLRGPANPSTPLRRVTSGRVVSSVPVSALLSDALTFADGKLYTSDNSQAIYSIDPNTGATAQFKVVGAQGSTSLRGLCSDGSNLWATSSRANQLWRIPLNGNAPALIIGATSNLGVNEPNNVDGPAATARLFEPTGVACGAAANKVFIADTGNHTVRVLDTSTNAVSTLAGTPIAQGAVDGTGGAARFRFPNQVVADSQGNWFVTDSGNAVIRKITPAGAVTLFAGSFGNPGFVDGTGAAARFSRPTCRQGNGCPALGIAIDASDNLYVADNANAAIRKITPAGAVTTVASGSAVYTPSERRFNSIAADSVTGDIYFTSNDGVRRWSKSDGTIALLIPFNVGTAATFQVFVGVDSQRRKLYVAAKGNGPGGAEIVRYGGLPGFSGLTFATSQRELSLSDSSLCLDSTNCAIPGQVAIAPNGAVAIAYPYASVVRRIAPNFLTLDTIAGSLGSFGRQDASREGDGRGAETGPLPARLNNPTGIAFNARGQFAVVMGAATANVYVAWGEGAVLVSSGFVP